MMLPMPQRVPETVEPGFRAFVARVFGDEGRAWIAALPEAHATLATRWQLELGPELPGGLLACVREARLPDGSAAVLKVGTPWPRTRHEVAALRAWGGNGAPELLDFDKKLGAMLLERIHPGTHPSEAGAAAVAALMDALHVPPFAGLPTLGELVRRRIERALAEGRTSEAKASWALSKAAELQPEPHPVVLLHGDFDERNLLVCEHRGLCAIDPLPCAGDPAYDAGYWVHGNRGPGRRARLDALVSLGFDRTRVRDWAAVIAVHG
jgi:streptomycin 6-kinase